MTTTPKQAQGGRSKAFRNLMSLVEIYGMDELKRRFMEKISIDKNGCWIHTCKPADTGYGQQFLGKASHKAHQLSWLIHGREFIEGLVLDHICRNRRCANPDHLRQVTYKENTLSGTSIVAINKAKTACYLGHPLSGENLYIRVNGSRVCVACEKARKKSTYVNRKKARLAVISILEDCISLSPNDQGLRSALKLTQEYL